MATSITTNATALEGQLLEVAREMQIKETAQSATNRVTITSNIENGTVTINATLPATLSGTGGAVNLAVDEYLS
ncbi:MAG: hypothetical protein F6K19_46560 [Cyanothece sp. SIO1E1]|nr:hypothetical protein [Cyanothece sp. SIO1E1]